MLGSMRCDLVLVAILPWSLPAFAQAKGSAPSLANGLSTTVNISFGCAFVAGKNRVPNPAAGNTAFRTRCALRGLSVMITRRNQTQN